MRRRLVVRVTPGASLGELVGFAGAPRGTHMRWLPSSVGGSRTGRIANSERSSSRIPFAPVAFLVTDRGYLVTLDNWHNRGYGKAVAAYSPEGDVVAAWELRDLFLPGEIGGFQHSVSSITWRRDTVYVREGQQSVYVALDEKGGELIVEVGTGRWQICERRSGTHLCRATNARRVWRPYREPATTK